MFRQQALAPKFLIFLWFVSLGQGQTSHGSVVGTLTDTAGGAIYGAPVRLEPTDARAVTDRQGRYTFADVVPGSYTLSVSFIGFAPYSSPVTVAPGQAAHADAVLQVATRTEEVIVTDARPHGEAEAINRERTAENILQVLPSEVIRSLPNANVADAIGRLPSVTLERDEGEGKYVQIRGTEPRYSNVTIDGVNVPSPEAGARQIKLDVIPSDLVESVEISKTLLANQDGDAIGGSVNLRTRTAGDCGGNPLLPPVSANAPYFGNYNKADLRDYAYDRTRSGFEGSVDYRLSDTASVYVRGLYSHFNNYGDRWLYTPTINSYTTSALQGGGDGSISSNAQIRRPVQVIGSMVAGGRHSWGASTFIWEVSAARSATEDKGYSQANFVPADSSPLNAVLYSLNLTNPYRPKFVVQNGVNLYDSAQYVMQSTDALDVNTTYSPQVNLSGAAAYSRGYNWSGHLGTFEVGGKFRNAHKFQESNDLYYDVAGSKPISMAEFLGTLTDKNYYDRSYTQGPFVNYNKVTSFFGSNPGLFALDTNLTHSRNDPNNYNLLERVSAGYFMNTIEFGKWRFYTGLRLEGTDETVVGRQVLFSSAKQYVSTAATRNGSSYVNPLPSAEIRYSMSSSSDIRLAYGRGIARPNYIDLVPYVSVDDSTRRASIGNPNLQATKANNYDLLYEHYLNPLGLLQAGVFFKDIRTPIYSITRDVTGVYAPGLTYQQTGPVNGSSAWIAGFEVSFQQRLSYLPWRLNAFGISANYSYTDSPANGLGTLLGRTDHPALQRQAPSTWNVSPTYDKGRVSLRMGIAYNQANIFSYQYSDGAPLGTTGPNGDQYLYTHLQIDAQASVRLNHGLSAIVYGLNLNNEVFGFYQGSTIWPIQREYYKPTFGFGMRWEPVTERF